jgi:hypothetical protein
MADGLSEALTRQGFAGEGVGIVDNPAWFLDRLDFRRGVATFTRATRGQLSDTVFLDHRWARGDAPQRTIAIDALGAFGGDDRPALIWHSAFCCSTLIASLLDVPGVSLSLKEPVALVDLADARRAGAPAADDRLVSAVFAQLARPRAAGERVIVKPSNGANVLVSADTGGPALLLYSSCREFILSVVGGGPLAGGGEERRRFARVLLTDRAIAVRPTVPWRPVDLSMMTDLQIAALLWHAQVSEFRAVARKRGPARARSLDCAAFLASPGPTLAALDGFLGLGLGTEGVATVMTSDKLGRYAKSPSTPFSTDQRRRELEMAAAPLGSALDAVVAWSYQVCPGTPPGDPIGSPLIGAA